MTRQILNIGSTANDGTGDTLRAAGQKINENFIELYQALGGDSDTLSTKVRVTTDAVEFEGSTPDAFETSLKAVDPTADRTINLPDASGTLVLDTNTQTITNKTLENPILITPRIQDSASYTYTFVPGTLTANTNINLPNLTDSDTFVFSNAVQTITNKTVSASIFQSPKISGGIFDTNGAEVFGVGAAASAVNYLHIQNAATGNAPVLETAGDDSDINLQLGTKGSGAIEINSRLVYKSEILTASGSINPNIPTTIFDAAGAISLTLANGSQAGESKYLINEGAAEATVTPTNFSNGTSFTLRQDATTQLIWSGDNWHLIISKYYDSSDTDALIYVTA